jgi:large subunit ribosomal protein L36
LARIFTRAFKLSSAPTPVQRLSSRHFSSFNRCNGILINHISSLQSSPLLLSNFNNAAARIAVSSSSPVISSPAVLIQQQTRSFKVRSAIKKKCEHCYIRRKKNKKWYVYCKVNPRHKQRQL